MFHWSIYQLIWIAAHFFSQSFVKNCLSIEITVTRLFSSQLWFPRHSCLLMYRTKGSHFGMHFAWLQNERHTCTCGLKPDVCIFWFLRNETTHNRAVVLKNHFVRNAISRLTMYLPQEQWWPKHCGGFTKGGNPKIGKHQSNRQWDHRINTCSTLPVEPSFRPRE